jgi:hypothetical protein
MKKKASRPPYGLVIVAIVLAGFGLLFGSIGGMLFSAEVMETNIFLLAIPFLTIFIAILLVFIFSINMMARVLDYNVSRRVYKVIEAVIMAGIVLGIIAMFQPWVFALFRYGFQVLLISTLAFIVWSHVTPQRDPRMGVFGATSPPDLDGVAEDSI